LHRKEGPDQEYLDMLSLIEKGADDERNFVMKGVNWALRSIGRRNLALNKAAVAVAQRLAEAEEKAPRWVGKDALRELTNPKVLARLKVSAKTRS
jgi:3-methyladenine DNA glycosylase AlkD